MKKVLFSAFFSAIMFLGVLAQPCTPEVTLTSPGLYPDSTNNLPPGTVNVYYEAIISAFVPTDTVYMGLTAQIDSIGVVTVLGLPTGLSWVSDTPSNFWEGGTKGCIKISGTTTVEGLHSLQIPLMIHGKLSGMPLTMPDTIRFYEIDMQPANVAEFSGEAFTVGQAFPNPANELTNIEVSSVKPMAVKFELYNLVGVKVAESTHQLNAGSNNIAVALKQFPSGMYFYKISDGNKIITRKLNISR
jgi:hypothetical protein